MCNSRRDTTLRTSPRWTDLSSYYQPSACSPSSIFIFPIKIPTWVISWTPGRYWLRVREVFTPLCTPPVPGPWRGTWTRLTWAVTASRSPVWPSLPGQPGRPSGPACVTPAGCRSVSPPRKVKTVGSDETIFLIGLKRKLGNGKALPTDFTFLGHHRQPTPTEDFVNDPRTF